MLGLTEVEPLPKKLLDLLLGDIWKFPGGWGVVVIHTTWKGKEVRKLRKKMSVP